MGDAFWTRGWDALFGVVCDWESIAIYPTDKRGQEENGVFGSLDAQVNTNCIPDVSSCQHLLLSTGARPSSNGLQVNHGSERCQGSQTQVEQYSKRRS